MRRREFLLLSASFVGPLACGRTTNQGGGSSAILPDSDGSFALAGDAESASGARWTFRGASDGVTYDLGGVLVKPPGEGPFPAVILSHGFDGNAAFFSSQVAPTMSQWGLVCVATNYTHSTGVPIGAPGNARQPGASHANVLRAHMTRALLPRLGYVDMSRVAAHGHSMGAYLGVAWASAYPSDLRVASHTGGGVRPAPITAGPAPTPTQALGVRTPLQMHHGDADTVVPLSYDQRLDSLLATVGVDHQLFVYQGADHLAVRTSRVMFAHVHDWYAAHGMF